MVAGSTVAAVGSAIVRSARFRLGRRRRASIVKMMSATHTNPKPASRAGGIGS